MHRTERQPVDHHSIKADRHSGFAHWPQAMIINPAFAFPLASSYDKHGADLVVTGKRQGVLAGNSRSALMYFGF